ncbi:MAG: protein phosphatase 2C domain-containing protein [Gammaproteobacteria bacterium]|nr:protein phosphatase 2C domain-containing protein [Gammaproteobacteria bacterium]MBT8105828.1 protein phosphatase 2C domain-containing protein [Gammaproteobacteria bacterium]NNF49838.1 serine/threonine protein phosphatase [Woeseiaceae bacterium]NNK25842.1 serine/threonine protein phosphatase [Woeseiaceae bacterium]NNL64165.1 serine/threonine protein phosphatase [Woeseiaceae bacterium]
MNESGATPQHDLLVLDGALAPDAVELEVAGGTAFALTQRDPDKETENEDTVAIVAYGADAAVLVVADGAGGLPAGKTASLTAVTTLAASLQSSREHATLLRTAILNGIEAANEAVIAIGNGCATTMTVITIEGLVARSYQIGDSEALVVGQRSRIRLQTTAHSPTGFAVEAGFLDQRDALHHEERHLVSNFMGTSDMRIDMGPGVELRPRDTVLVASDGLTDNVHLDEIIEHVRKGPLPDCARDVAGLAQHRMQRGDTNQPSKPDDLSLILFRKPDRARIIDD